MFAGCWVALLVAIVLVAIALGIVGGPAAVCGFIGVVLAASALCGVYMLHLGSGEAVDEVS